MTIGRASFPKDTAVGGFPYGADQGMKWMAGAGLAGSSIQHLYIPAGVIAGGNFTLNFANYGLSDMYDANYVVIVQSDDAAGSTALITEGATKTTSQCVIQLTVALKALNILIVGRLAGQAG